MAQQAAPPRAHDAAEIQRHVRRTTFTSDILLPALWRSVVKLDPRWMIKNPVMFVVEIGAVLTLLLTIDPTIFGQAAASRGYNAVVTMILVVTVLFANYAEAVAEGRGRAQAATLRRVKKDTPAKRVRANGSIETVTSTDLRKGDIVLVEVNDLVPGDGDVVEGVAYVNEAAITGESAPGAQAARHRHAELGHRRHAGGHRLHPRAHLGESR